MTSRSDRRALASNKTVTLRAALGWALPGGLALAISGCATPPGAVQQSSMVATPPATPSSRPVPPGPPPPMPPGGYIGMKSPTKRADGRYFTPNLDNTDQAAVWHLRNALNVAALGCDQAGGGVVEHYNAWLKTHAAAIDRYYQAYIREWQAPGWWDWQRVYDDNQTRIYNFYAQPAIRAAFCAVAREEVAKVGQVADADLPTFARAALQRLDRPFIEFFAAYDAWRNYYQPAPPTVVPPPVVRTVDAPVAVTPPPAARTLDAPVAVIPPAVVPTLGGSDSIAADTESPAPAPNAAPIAESPPPQ